MTDQLTINVDVLRTAGIKTPAVDEFHSDLADWQQRHDEWVKKVRQYFVDGYDVPVAELICFGEAAEFERSQLESDRTDLAWRKFELWRSLGVDFRAAVDAALANQLSARAKAVEELEVEGLTPDVFYVSANPAAGEAVYERKIQDRPCMLIANKRVADAQVAYDAWEATKAIPPSDDVCRVVWPSPSSDDERFIDSILKRNVANGREVGVPAQLVYPELADGARPISWSNNEVHYA